MSGLGVLLLSVLSVAAPAGPAPPAERLLHAHEAYERGEFDRAAQLYGGLIEPGEERGLLLYNLGNAQLRGGRLGPAIASYRRALLALPRDEDVRANLRFARRSARDALEPPGPPALVETIFFWHYRLSPAELAWITGLASLLFWSLLLVRLFRPQLPGSRAVAAALLAVALAAGGSLVARRLAAPTVAVVVPPQVSAHAAPDPDSVVRFKLHAGAELAVRARRDGWLRVALPDRQQGWIRAEWAEQVRG